MISGANRGLGNAIARRLHDDGYNVSVGGRDIDALRRSMDGYDDDRVLCHCYDATQPETGAAWIHATIEQFGSLSGLVNNAGIIDTAELDVLTEESLDAMWALSEATKQAGWDDGVRVTSVCPGFVATDMTKDFGGDQATMIDAADLAELISTTISLPNTASVAQLNVACRLEPHF